MAPWIHILEYGKLIQGSVCILLKVEVSQALKSWLLISYLTIGHQSLTSGMELKSNTLVSGNADSTVKVNYHNDIVFIGFI